MYTRPFISKWGGELCPECKRVIRAGQSVRFSINEAEKKKYLVHFNCDAANKSWDREDMSECLRIAAELRKKAQRRSYAFN